MKKKSKLLTFILSFIPGLGQIYLNYTTRGLSFIVACIGCGFISLFLHGVLGSYDFSMFFLLLIPVIWLVAMVDSMILCEKINTLNSNNINTSNNINEEKDAADNSINDGTSNKFAPTLATATIETKKNFENNETIKKQNNKTIAMLLSIIPGAGHMFLKLPKQGIQLMFLFFLSLYLQNFTRLDLFLIFAPIIWFFSLFDVMHKCSSAEELIDNDLILVTWFSLENPLLQNRSKFLGWILLLIGILAIIERILIPISNRLIGYQISEYTHVGIVAALFIAGGIKLLSSNKNNT